MKAKNIIGFSLGPLSSAILGVVTLPLMSWIFKPEDIGRINLAGIAISLGLMIITLGLDQAYVREFHATEEKYRLFKACITPGLLAFVTFASISIKFSQELSAILFGEINSQYWIITLACIAASFFSRFLGLILRMEEKGLSYSISQVAPKIIQIIFLFLIIILDFERNFLNILWILAASIVTATIIYAWNTRYFWINAVKTKINGNQIKSLLKFGAPLIFSNLAYWGLSASSAIIIRSQSTLSELGVYSVTNSFASSAAIFQSIFTIVWAPTVYKWVEQGVDMRRVDAIARQALTVICIIFTIIGSFSWLTDFILPKHYINVKYIIVCAIAPSLLYTLSEITCIGIGITRRTTLTVWITLIALISNVLVSCYLVPFLGAKGAVIANAIAYTVFFIARTEVSARVWREFPRFNLNIHVIVLITISIITALLGNKLPFHYSLIWVALIPVFAYSLRAEFTSISKLIMK